MAVQLLGSFRRHSRRSYHDGYPDTLGWPPKLRSRSVDVDVDILVLPAAKDKNNINTTPPQCWANAHPTTLRNRHLSLPERVESRTGQEWVMCRRELGDSELGGENRKSL